MNTNLTDIVVVLDESGSMGLIRKDTIGGLNTFIADQKKQPGKANFTLIRFNEHVDIRPTLDLNDVKEFVESDFIPSGMTALLDACGKAIDSTGRRLSYMHESNRPGKVLMVIITDGEENSSKEYKRSKVAEMIKHQQSVYSWAFLFMGANIDSFTEAQSLGIPKAFACNYLATGDGIKSVMCCMSNSTSKYRSGGSAAINP